MPQPKRQAKRVKLTSPETEEFPVEKLAPNGDVILIVGTEKKRIQIHSDFLRLVSPIFDTMLQSQSTMPHESRGVCQMELPGDDGQAMSLLLRALYGGDPELDSLKPKEIQQISMLANKYGMAPRVSRQAVTWLHGTKMKDPEEFWYLLNAAYWLERPESFRLISKGVVKFANISLLQLASGTTDVLRGFRLALALEELRVFKPRGGGLCLHCFKTATTKFMDRGAQCPDATLHSIS